MESSPIVKDVHIYVLKDNQLKHYTGNIYKKSYAFGYYFKMTDSNGVTRTGWDCGVGEGEVYHLNVWFRERDDQRAYRCFIDYEEAQMLSLKKKLESHERKLNMLKVAARESL